MKAKLSPFAAVLLLVLLVAALALTWFNFTLALPKSLWFKAMRQPDIDAIDQMLFHYSLLPRGDFAAGWCRIGPCWRIVPAGAAQSIG